MKKTIFLLIPVLLILGSAGKVFGDTEQARVLTFANSDTREFDEMSEASVDFKEDRNSLLNPKTEEILKVSETEESKIEKRQKFNKLSKGTSQIYKLAMRSNVVYRIQTALGYVSTVDLPEEALKVFIGDAELFKASVYGKEVLIKPMTDYKDARTNLTIITDSGRLVFDVSVGPAETADFVLDFRMPEDDVLVENAFQKAIEEKNSVIQKSYEEKEKNLEQNVQKLAEENLKKEMTKKTEAILLRETAQTDDVRLNLLSLSTIGEKTYLRFGIRNLSNTPYKISKVVVGAESYEKKAFGLAKDPQGLAEFPSEFEIKNPVPASDYVYGVVILERRAIGKKEYPVFLLLEEDGKRNLRIQNFKWLS